MCSRHEKECGEAFVCESCGESFKSKNSLGKHLKRKGHQPSKITRLASRIKRGARVIPLMHRSTSRPASVNSATQQVLVLLVPIMRKSTAKKDSSTQTESSATPSSPVAQQFYDNLSPDITELLDLAIQTDVSSFSNEITSNELLDFGTQTSWGELLSNECSSQTPSDWPDCCLNKLLTFDSQTQTVQQSTDGCSQT